MAAGDGKQPEFFKGKDRPVEQVSWYDAQEFLKRMNDRGDGYRYRLPTEAEWSTRRVRVSDGTRAT